MVEVPKFESFIMGSPIRLVSLKYLYIVKDKVIDTTSEKQVHICHFVRYKLQETNLELIIIHSIKEVLDSKMLFRF